MFSLDLSLINFLPRVHSHFSISLALSLLSENMAAASLNQLHMHTHTGKRAKDGQLNVQHSGMDLLYYVTNKLEGYSVDVQTSAKPHIFVLTYLLTCTW